jgi:hypothetical protein
VVESQEAAPQLQLGWAQGDVVIFRYMADASLEAPTRCSRLVRVVRVDMGE